MKLTFQVPELAPIQSCPHSMRAARAEIASEIRESIGHVGGSHYCVCRGPFEIKAEAQDDRLQLLQALEPYGAVVSDAESVVSREVPARRRQTAMPAPQPSAKRLCNDPLAPEAADVDWMFDIGIPKKNAQSARIHRHYLHLCLRHIKSQGKTCANKELAEAYYAC